MIVDGKQFNDTVRIVASAVMKKPNLQVLGCVRVICSGDGDRASLMAFDGSNLLCRYIETGQLERLDFCVEAGQLKAAASTFRKEGRVDIKVGKSHVMFTQKDGPTIKMRYLPSDLFPVEKPFDQMQYVYKGENPIKGLQALEHCAVTNAGSTPLYGMIILMNNCAFAQGWGSNVRCDFSLIQVDTPLIPYPVPITATWMLKHFGDEVTAYLDEQRILVVDDGGYLVIRRAAAETGTFPDLAEKTFASLKMLGEMKVRTGEAKNTVASALAVVGTTPNDPLYIDLVSGEGVMVVQAERESQSFKNTLDAKTIGNYRVPIHAERLLSFLKSTGDEEVAIRIMGSDRGFDPMRFVHLVDSKLHEVIGIGGERRITHGSEEEVQSG